MTKLYHFWWSPESQRVRLALGYKQIAYDDRPIAFDDDQTFYELGIARQVPVLQLDDGTLLTDSLSILQKLDHYWPQFPIFTGVVPARDWEDLLAWQQKAAALLGRLQAAVLPAYRGIGDSNEALASCKAEVRFRLGSSIEELSNDRYAAFNQLMQLAQLKKLASRVAKHRFYFDRPSAADMLLAADLFALQLLDGATLPIDLMYYIERIEDTCRTRLRECLLITT